MNYQAHRGLSFDLPENTTAAVLAAAQWGYDVAEIDVGVTRDGVFVLMHDDTINRTARTKDGSVPDVPLYLKDLTYQEAAAYDYGRHKGKRFAGTPLPKLSDLLPLAQKLGIRLKLDNKYEKLSKERQYALFDLIEPYADTAALTCDNPADLRHAMSCLPRHSFHYDGAVDDRVLQELHELLPKDRLTVWLPLKNENTSWVKVPFAQPDLVAQVKQIARLGLWLLTEETQRQTALDFGADIIETDGSLKPFLILWADMHTHSDASPDCSCPFDELYEAQKRQGSTFFALTDHCEISQCKESDVFSPVRRGCEAAAAFGRAHKGFPVVLTGIEVGNLFRYPEVAPRLYELYPFDVMLTSIHAVKYNGRETSYSRWDFSAFTPQEIHEFLTLYFNSLLHVVQTCHMDVVTHLTCPLRYITGRYGIPVDLTPYRDTVTAILQTVIDRELALEVNTSGFASLDTTMPDESILRQYYAMGGRLITIGSDAHVSTNAAYRFREAVSLLKDIGFSHAYLYRNRIPYAYSL